MRLDGPDDRAVLIDPTPEQLEKLLRNEPHAYWQQGGNGEAMLDAGPGESKLLMKQPEPGWFFFTLLQPSKNDLVPYNGGSCEELVKDERGGDPFYIPRACLVHTEQAVAVVRTFLADRRPTSAITWQYWDELPLPELAIRWSGGA